MKTSSFESHAAQILSVLGSPFRVRLVLALSAQEACVCHLEALLKKRQAYISQHLMALREANLLDTRREGKFIYYRLSNPAVLDLIRQAGLIAGMPAEDFPQPAARSLEKCACPHCTGASCECDPSPEGFPSAVETI